MVWNPNDTKLSSSKDTTPKHHIKICSRNNHRNNLISLCFMDDWAQTSGSINHGGKSELLNYWINGWQYVHVISIVLISMWYFFQKANWWCLHRTKCTFDALWPGKYGPFLNQNVSLVCTLFMLLSCFTRALWPAICLHIFNCFKPS